MLVSNHRHKIMDQTTSTSTMSILRKEKESEKKEMQIVFTANPFELSTVNKTQKSKRRQKRGRKKDVQGPDIEKRGGGGG